MSLLRGENISFSYTDKKVLDQVNICVEQGEFIGILGRNGSGKSTLVKNLARILRPCGGRVLLEGRDISQYPAKKLATEIAMMGQEEALPFPFTAYEMAAMGRAPHKKLFQRDDKEDIRLIRDALKQTGAHELADREFSSLSGGERQRVLIARALVQQAQILLLDEPTNHLDICFRLQLMEMLRGLGLTVAAAIHDLELAAAYCHRLYVLEKGKVICDGAPHQVITAELLSEVFRIKGRVEIEDDGSLYIKYLSAGGDMR